MTMIPLKVNYLLVRRFLLVGLHNYQFKNYLLANFCLVFTTSPQRYLYELFILHPPPYLIFLNASPKCNNLNYFEDLVRFIWLVFFVCTCIKNMLIALKWKVLHACFVPSIFNVFETRKMQFKRVELLLFFCVDHL